MDRPFEQIMGLEDPTCRREQPPDGSRGEESRARIIVATGLAIGGIVILAIKLTHRFELVGGKGAGWLVAKFAARAHQMMSGWSLAEMLVYPMALLLILVLERKYPAVASQKTLSKGLVNDALWVLVEAMVNVAIIRWYSGVLYGAYQRHFSYLTLPSMQSLPVLPRLAIGAVVLDLMSWCQHWLHHHVKWLWPFHAVHHSQRELNLFSDYRVHFMEYFIRITLAVIPTLLLGLDALGATWWVLLLSWHARFYHANIRSNFGWLRYVFVTPQSHRVHHSLEPEHHDCNFGAMLSVWDYLLGTQYRRYDVYPRTGIEDEDFPHETAGSVWGVLWAPVRQMIYPFRRIGRLFKPVR
jgi:sterol desaturase/sphingolipid hydroxylase (fatty acid hydroxylase superfamily)